MANLLSKSGFLLLYAYALALLLVVYLPGSVGAFPSFSLHSGASQNANRNQPYRPWAAFRDRVIHILWPVAPHDRSPSQGSGSIQARQPWSRYSHQVVLRFYPRNRDDGLRLLEACDTLFLDIWERNSEWFDIRLTKETVPSLLQLLPDPLRGLHVPLMRDVDLALSAKETHPEGTASSERFRHPARESRFTPHLQATGVRPTNPFFAEYQPLSVIQPWMRLMQSVYSTHVKAITIGTSAEGRDISAFRLGVHPTYPESSHIRRKTIVIAGGIHARDWISTSTINYVANSLITSYGKTTNATELLEKFDWVFIPTLNPDGYVYSFASDRLWHKSRQQTPLSYCRGIDLARTWSTSVRELERNPFSESFAGPTPLQSEEVRSFAEWAKKENNELNGSKIVAFIHLASYSQTVLHSLSGKCSDDSKNTELDDLGQILADSFSLHGETYEFIASCPSDSKDLFDLDHSSKPKRTIYLDGNSAMEWFHDQLNVLYSFTVKLRDGVGRGFLPSKDQIVPTGEEIAQGMYRLAEYLQRYEQSSEESSDMSALQQGKPCPEVSLSETQKPMRVAAEVG